MKITPRFDCVTGSFETNTDDVVCSANEKYGHVCLCFAAGMNIEFAQIKLYSSNLAKDAAATFEDARKLGDEIARRWNAGRPKKPLPCGDTVCSDSSGIVECDDCQFNLERKKAREEGPDHGNQA